MGVARFQKPKQGKARGFTLVELLVVMSVIAITSAVAAPSVVSWIKNYEAKTVARQLMTDLQFARMNAVSSKLQCRVNLNIATNQYEIDQSPDGGTTWNIVGIARQLNVQTIGANQKNPYYAPGITLGMGQIPSPIQNWWTVTFNTMGVPQFNAANVYTATINQGAVAAYSVQVNPIGAATINGGPGFAL
jgi:prepilin-type N-terminal cleavage/methylation domain-containing protein